jgi:hypothetical protein
VAKVSYWDWFYHVSRKWVMPPDATAAELWVAVVMATFNDEKSDKGIYPSAERLAERANLSLRQAKRLRKLAVRHGLFAERSGEFHRGVPVLDLAIPADWSEAKVPEEPKPAGVTPVSPQTRVGVTDETSRGDTSVPLGVTPMSPESSKSSYQSSEDATASESSYCIECGEVDCDCEAGERSPGCSEFHPIGCDDCRDWNKLRAANAANA